MSHRTWTCVAEEYEWGGGLLAQIQTRKHSDDDELVISTQIEGSVVMFAWWWRAQLAFKYLQAERFLLWMTIRYMDFVGWIACEGSMASEGIRSTAIVVGCYMEDSVVAQKLTVKQTDRGLGLRA